MSSKGPVTPKGFGDIFPEEVKKRQAMFGAIIPVLEKYGFEPLETPTVEFADTLLGKYGEEEKLVYTFEDKGGRRLALRYDLTVPLARFVANNLGLLNPTFSRYQIGQVFRGENTQKGRKREFTQFDFDIVGSDDIKEDVRVIITTIIATRKIGLNQAILQINDRQVFDNLGLSAEAVTIIDKIDKIGKDEVTKLLKEANVEKADIVLEKLEKSEMPERLAKIFEDLREKDVEQGNAFEFNPFLARGLNYYTSTVMELKLDKTPGGLSIGGGGRYDNLIGMFAGRKIPAVGFSFGIDRIIDLL